jgi:hypothetical protein
MLLNIATIPIVMLLLKFICTNWNMFAVYATFTVSFSEGAVATYFNVIEVINSGTWFTASVPVVPSTAWPLLPPRAPPV